MCRLAEPWHVRLIGLSLLLVSLSGCNQQVYVVSGDCTLGPPWLGAWWEPDLWPRLPPDDPNASVGVALHSPAEASPPMRRPDAEWGGGNWSLQRLGWRHDFVHDGRERSHRLVLGPGEDRAKITATFYKPADADVLRSRVMELVTRVTPSSEAQVREWVDSFMEDALRLAHEEKASYIEATKSLDGPFNRSKFVDSLAPFNAQAGLPGTAQVMQDGWFADFELATQSVRHRDADLPRLVVDAGGRTALEIDHPQPPTREQVREATAGLLAPFGLPPARGFPTEFHPNVACAQSARFSN